MNKELLYKNKFLGDNIKTPIEIDETDIYQKKTIVNIDSSTRLIDPINISIEGSVRLKENPLLFNHNQSLIKILHDNHTYQVNDKLTINNVSSINVNLYNVLSIKKNSQYIRIEHQNHGISLVNLFNVTNTDDLTPVYYVERLDTTENDLSTIYSDDKQNYILNERIVLDLEIIVSGVNGNFTNINRTLDNVNLNNFIFDIPINVINKKQTIYPIIFYDTNTGTYIIDKDAYLIKLPQKAQYNYLDGSTFNYIDSTFINVNNVQQYYETLNDVIKYTETTTKKVNNNTTSISMLNIFNIPINYIEADYPLSSYRRQGYHTIKYSGKNYYIIDVGKKANCENQNQFSFSTNINDSDTIFNSGGGKNIIVRKIINEESAYPSPSSYKIKLNRTFKNVSQIKMISSEIPNTFRLVSEYNNKLYWQNLNDGSYIYEIVLETGNYDPKTLSKEIEMKMNNVIRVPYMNETYPELYYAENNTETYKYHNFVVSIDIIKDIVSFQSYRIVNLFGNKTISIPDNKIIVTLQSHNLTNTSSFYLIVTDSSPGNLYINSSNRIYKLTSINDDGTLNMLLDTTTIYISNNITVNSSIIYENLIFTTTNTHLIVNVINGIPLNLGDFIYRSLDNFLYTVSEVLGNNLYAIVLSTTGIIVGNTLINITTTPEANFIFQSYINVPSINYKMIIYHMNHNINVGDEIIISNSSSIAGVSSSIINSSHKVVQIINDNEYLIYINSNKKVNSGINDVVVIKYPNLFRLRFDFQNTIGNLLGFHSAGEQKSVTKYSNIINNTDLYEEDVTYDSIGVSKEISSIGKKKVLELNGLNYIFITSNILSSKNHLGPLSNIFAKIIFTGGPGTINYDTFVDFYFIREIPITELSVIDFSFYLADGTLYLFNGVEHSFTIEITELENYSQGTQYNSRLNAITNDLIKNPNNLK